MRLAPSLLRGAWAPLRKLGYDGGMLRGLGALGLLALASCSAIVGFDGLQRVAATEKGPVDPDEEEDDDEEETKPDSGRPEGGTGPACDRSKPFGPATLLPGEVNSTAHETSPALSADELTIVFQRITGVDGGDLLIATRPARDAPFGAPRLLTELHGNGADYDPTLTRDGLTLFYVEFKRQSPASMDIHVATRATRTENFGAPRRFDEVNTNDDETSPFVTPDGEEVWFLREGVLHRTVRDPQTNEFPASTPVAGAPSGLQSRFTLSNDLLTIYAATPPGSGNVDLVSARRTSPTASFGPLTSLGDAVNSGSADYRPWISEDECRIYFSSGRGGAKDEIFVAERPK